MVFYELFGMGLLGLFLGFFRLWREQRAWLASLLVFMVPAWLLPMIYLQGGEYDFWFLPLYIAFHITAGVGLAWILESVWKRTGRARAPMLGLVAPIWVNLPYVDRHDEYVPEDFGRNLFRHVDSDGILFAGSDEECSLTYYLQVVENLRPDVILIFAPLLPSRWYQQYVRDRYPELQVPELSLIHI